MSATDIDPPFGDRREVAHTETSEHGGSIVRVFITGASGFIGSAVAAELIDAGHQVEALARSEDAAARLAELGAEVRLGSLDDLDGLRAGAAGADGVVHCAYIHDFQRMEHAAAADLSAVEAFGEVLEGSGRPLVITCGTALVAPGRVATEDDSADPGAHPRVASERLALALAGRGVRSSVVRPGPSVHGEGDHGFVPILIQIARSKGVSAYVGDGSNRWPAVHRLDAGRLYRLALESATPGSVFHAVADEGIPTREIAEVIGRHLSLPVASLDAEQARAHFDWMARFWGVDAPASSALTRERLGWRPVEVGLIEDLERGHYFKDGANAS
jgi:nucleoside-diphosphate-sugar epimerase